MRITSVRERNCTRKLVMTPQLKQAGDLLQLSVMELRLFLQDEMIRNPVFELEEEEGDNKKTVTVKHESIQEKDPIDWEEYLLNEGIEMPEPRLHSFEPSYAMDYPLTTEPTLQEHLLFQLGLCTLTPTEKRIGEFLIGNIDLNGYLKGDLNELAVLTGVVRPEVEAVLEVIQTFDPIGVGARTLQECLLLQIRERDDIMPLTQKIIDSYLADVADNKIKKMAAELHADTAAVQMAVDDLRSLNPRPGRLVGGLNDIRYIIPDVFVEKVQEEYCILVNEDSFPRLIINPYYRFLLEQPSGQSPVELFIKSKLDSALWLIRSIEQRRITLYCVTECICRLQRDFFKHGIKYLKPMALRQVAEEVGMREPIVSRAAYSKYMQTPRGLYPFAFFLLPPNRCQVSGRVKDTSVR